MAAQGLHQAGNAVLGTWCGQQVHVVGHKHPSMDRDLVLACVLVEPVGVGGKVLVGSKTGLAIIAPLNDVLRDARQADPR